MLDGLEDGSLLEWDVSTLEEQQRLRCEGQVGGAWCMMAFGGLVTLGQVLAGVEHGDGRRL